MQGYATIEARKEWVQRELQGARFLYANPDAEVGHFCSYYTVLTALQTQRGAFRGHLVLETFAYHLNMTMNAPCTHGKPAAALALSAAAV